MFQRRVAAEPLLPELVYGGPCVGVGDAVAGADFGAAGRVFPQFDAHTGVLGEGELGRGREWERGRREIGHGGERDGAFLVARDDAGRSLRGRWCSLSAGAGLSGDGKRAASVGVLGHGHDRREGGFFQGFAGFSFVEGFGAVFGEELGEPSAEGVFLMLALLGHQRGPCLLGEIPHFGGDSCLAERLFARRARIDAGRDFGELLQGDGRQGFHAG